MNIIKPGKPQMQKHGEFYFKCKKCGCEWDADRGDEGFGISPPCMEFFTYMPCPCCGDMTYDRE
jgi:hypothetical protein